MHAAQVLVLLCSLLVCDLEVMQQTMLVLKQALEGVALRLAPNVVHLHDLRSNSEERVVVLLAHRPFEVEATLKALVNLTQAKFAVLFVCDLLLQL